MAYMESTQTLLDANGDPVNFSNSMNLDLNRSEFSLDEDGVVIVPPTLVFTRTPMTSDLKFIGDTVEVTISDIEGTAPSSVEGSIDGGLTYTDLILSEDTYSETFTITSNSDGYNRVKIRVVQSGKTYIINYGSITVGSATLHKVDPSASVAITSATEITVGGPINLFEGATATLLSGTALSDVITQVGVINEAGVKQFFDPVNPNILDFLQNAVSGPVGYLTGSPFSFVAGQTYSLFVSNGSGGNAGTAATVTIVSGTISATLGA
jgi:hypothetical protein